MIIVSVEQNSETWYYIDLGKLSFMPDTLKSRQCEEKVYCRITVPNEVYILLPYRRVFILYTSALVI